MDLRSTHTRQAVFPSSWNQNKPFLLFFHLFAGYFFFLLFSHFRGNIDYIIGLAAAVTVVFNPDPEFLGSKQDWH